VLNLPQGHQLSTVPVTVTDRPVFFV